MIYFLISGNLIPFLEELSAENNFDDCFVCESFISVPISLLKVFDVYSHLYDSKVIVLYPLKNFSCIAMFSQSIGFKSKATKV